MHKIKKSAAGGFNIPSFGVAAITLFVTEMLQVAYAAEPAKFDVREFVCPLGGEKFSQDVGYFGVQLVQFVDGSWLGDTQIDVQIPECPKNGLLLIPDYDSVGSNQDLSYLAFTPEQLERIPALLANKKFRALGKKGRHERAQWLATQLGLPVKTRWELLIRSSWAAVDAKERKRLVARITDEGPALINEFGSSEPEKLAGRMYVVNALREMGRFSEALEQLNSIKESIPSVVGGKDAQGAEDAYRAIAKMRETIEVRDGDRFPIGLSSSRWVDDVCGGRSMPPPYGPLTKNAKAACQRLSQESEVSESAYSEAQQLRENPEQLDRKCNSTPDSKRSPGLKEACKQVQQVRDRKTADDLLLHHAQQVATDCEATPATGQKGALFYACVSYRSFVTSALQGLLSNDDTGYGIVCGDDFRDRPDRASVASVACGGAQRTRSDQAKDKLLADPTALDITCAKTAKQDRRYPLNYVCDKRRADIVHAEAQRLASDSQAYAAACAGFALRNDYHSDASSEELRCSEAKRIRKETEEKDRITVLTKRCREQPGAVIESHPGFDCAALLARDKQPTRTMPISQPPDVNIYHRNSELSKVALESARRIVAKAKEEQTYPKRKPGDLH